jgi:glycosyltransferase involved in cell wall biosynthesis
MAKARIAVVDAMLGQRGKGTGSTSIWILEALKGRYAVDLITFGKPDFAALNSYWGTSIEPEDVKVVKIPHPFLGRTRRWTAIRHAYIGRFCRRVAGDYDVMFSTYNVMDFGQRGMQYVADFLFSDDLRRGFYENSAMEAPGLFYRQNLLRRLYLGISAAIYSPSWKMIRSNLTIANSFWSQRVLRESLSMDSRVIYPFIKGDFPVVPWDGKEPGFVCIGKLTPFKRIEDAISIVGRVREEFPDIHLHIIGWIEDVAYADKILSLCRANDGWCHREGEMAGERKRDFIASHKFGISCCRNEAFGLGVAEVVKSGGIAWVPNGGGQVEIADHSDLIYDDQASAVKKIGRVLADGLSQERLLAHLRSRAERFGWDVYHKEIRRAVEEFLEQKGFPDTF